MVKLRILSALLVAAATVTCGGCDTAPAAPVAPAAPPPPEVEVAVAVADIVTDQEVFTGRTEALNRADLRARVSGYLVKANFKQGADVRQGDVLFEIDPRPYEAALNQAQANVTLQQAQLTYNEAEHSRMQSLVRTSAVSKDDLEKARMARDTASASVRAAQATVESAHLNLEFTKVLAPFSGRISRRLVDPGNLIQQDVTQLASLVQLDPLYFSFDVDERTLLRIRGLISQAKIKTTDDHELTVRLGLADEPPGVYRHEGKVRFVDNKVDPMTGTLREWGELANTQRDLFPGMFVRVQMPVGIPRQSLFVAESALGYDQGSKYVYVVDADGKAQFRPVRVGPRKGGLIAVEEGLKPDERVVVNGLQRVRPKAQVVPKPVEMTTLRARAGDVNQASAKPAGKDSQGKAPAPTKPPAKQ